MAAVKPEVIPFEYFYKLKQYVGFYPRRFRNVILAMKDYSTKSVKCVSNVNRNGRVIIFCIRFIHGQIYQPLLAIYYSDKCTWEYASIILQFHWINLLRDLNMLKLNVVATISSAHYIFKMVVERIAQYKFDVGNPIVYPSPNHQEILHLFDINSLCHYLEKYLLNNDEILYFLNVNAFREHRWLQTNGLKIRRYTFVGELYQNTPHISNEPVVIFNPIFFYTYRLSVPEEHKNEVFGTYYFLSLCCGYVEVINSLALIKIYDLSNLTNSFRELKMLLATAYLVSPNDSQITYVDDMPGDEETSWIKYLDTFERSYANAMDLEVNALHVEEWTKKLIDIFNNIREKSLKKINLYETIQNKKLYKWPFTICLSMYEYREIVIFNLFEYGSESKQLTTKTDQISPDQKVNPTQQISTFTLKPAVILSKMQQIKKRNTEFFNMFKRFFGTSKKAAKLENKDTNVCDNINIKQNKKTKQTLSYGNQKSTTKEQLDASSKSTQTHQDEYDAKQVDNSAVQQNSSSFNIPDNNDNSKNQPNIPENSKDGTTTQSKLPIFPESSFPNSETETTIECTCYKPTTSWKICPLLEHKQFEEIQTPIDYYMSDEFLNKLYDIFLESPKNKSKSWLLQAWLATLNSFGLLHKILYYSNIRFIHAHCLNVNHIDHYVTKCNFPNGLDKEDRNRKFYPDLKEYNIFMNYKHLENILSRDLIIIEPNNLFT